MTPRFLERHGFNYPIMVTDMEGLGLKLPPPTFSVLDVERYVGKNKQVLFIMCRTRSYRAGAIWAWT